MCNEIKLLWEIVMRYSILVITKSFFHFNAQYYKLV